MDARLFRKDNPTLLGDSRLLRIDTLVDSEEHKHLRARNPSNEIRTVTDTWNTGSAIAMEQTIKNRVEAEAISQYPFSHVRHKLDTDKREDGQRYLEHSPKVYITAYMDQNSGPYLPSLKLSGLHFTVGCFRLEEFAFSTPGGHWKCQPVT